MNFSEKLKGLRGNKGITQEQLAELLAISRQAISKYESGAGYPDVKKIIHIAKIFNVSIDYLLDDRVEEEYTHYSKKTIVSIENLFKVIMKHYGIGEKKIMERVRDEKVIEARRVAMYLCNEHMGMSVNEIVMIFKRDFANVIHSISVIRGKITREKTFMRMIDIMAREIRVSDKIESRFY